MPAHRPLRRPSHDPRRSRDERAEQDAAASRQSHELQDLGEALVALPDDRA